MTGFVIAELALGGGVLGLCPLPADATAVAHWRPALVLSLTEAAEMGELGQSLIRAGIGWRHFPVQDYGIPDAAQDWAALSREIRAVLAQGGRVLIHCRGGCGRTGMAALRLMVESGEAGDTALQRLRQVRPCAVETEAQRLWAVSAPVS